MDSVGIDKALVGAFEGIFYTDVQVSNRALHHAVKKHRSRLLPMATINPAFPGWRDDVAECDEQWRTTGIRLFPSYHKYTLGDACFAELLAEASRRDLAVQVCVGRLGCADASSLS